MKIQRVFVLRFNDGRRIPYGVPEFLSEDEAEDFLAYVQGEISEGAAGYFDACCREMPKRVGTRAGQGADASGDTGGAAEREIRFAAKPTERVRRLEAYANGMYRDGLRSFALRAAERDWLEAARLQRYFAEQELAEQNKRQDRGVQR